MSLQLLEELDRDRFEVCMYVHERLPIQFDPSRKQLGDIIFGVTGYYRRWHLFRHLCETLRLARGADVIVGSNEGRASGLALFAGMVLRRPVVLWLHADWSRFSRIVSWRTRLVVRFFQQASVIVACSQGVASSHANAFPSARGRLHVITNCIDVSAIESAASVDLPEDMQGLFEAPTVVAVGRLDRQKGHDLLIRAHALALQAGIKHNLFILGDGGEGAMLKKLAAKLEVTDTVHFLGFQENPYRFMARATLFVLASRFEGFGLVVAEALACRVPVVAFDCPSGPAEILQNGRYGVLVPPQDTNALSKAIISTLADVALRRHLADGGPSRAQHFGVSAFSAAWSEVLETAAERK
ncbi:glycosyltransferase [Pontibaca sp. S1109L]|uniref:Glycosyltransferase n=2 Tax=Pontibaca salina TaxID=2795731 RepID=A0A934HMK8_9RHOB|nr:glycosyltransferase [Pontibaca salina]